MDHFQYKAGELHCEDVPVAAIAAEVGTPTYVYSTATLLHHYRQIIDAFAPIDITVCYAIKTCGNLHICRLLAQQGCGFDVTSGGELFRALKAGGRGQKIIYAGVGKTDTEIVQALRAGIAAFNIESEEEARNIDRLAGEMKMTATGAIRVNPDVDAKTHHLTTTGLRGNKFGIDLDRVPGLFDELSGLKHLKLRGIHMHIGSAGYQVQPYVQAVTRINELIDRLQAKGHRIETFDLGGGFGASYERPGQARPIAEYAQALLPLLRDRSYRVALEPGRYIAGNAGILLTRVLYRKTSGQKRFVIVDGAMNDLIRPVLYDSYHFIWPTKPDQANVPASRERELQPADGEVVDVVGPICESGDFLAQDRPMPRTTRGDLLAVFTAGAYGFAMSSNYNNRPRAAEVLVDGQEFKVIRTRETVEDLVRGEEST
jgi:diaminopimelate decarboxylase